MYILVGLTFVVLLLGVLVSFLPRDEEPNARIIMMCGDDLRAELTCPDCGARQMIRFTAGAVLAAVPCRECDFNIQPIFGWECQQLILRAIQEAAGEDEAAAAVREA